MRKVLFLIHLILACATCVTGMAQKSIGYTLDFKLSARNFVDTIAIDYEHGQVFVPVEMGGERMRFLLDTGASQAVVYDDRPIEGCTDAGSIVSHDAIGRIDTVKMLRLPPLTIGQLTLTGCKATLQHRTVRRRNVDGIIGFDIVNKGLLMKIDVKNRQLILTDRKRFFKKEHGYDARYRLVRHVPFVTVSPFEGYSERVLFDTGSRQLYAINKQSFDKAEPLCKVQNNQQIEGRSWGRHAMGFSGTEPLGEVVFLGIDRLLWGTFAFGDVHTLTTQGGSHIGARILEYGTVTIDPRRKRMRFQPYGDVTHIINIGNKQIDKAIVNDHGRPVVGLVWERSEAYQAGLREGDIILKADDRRIESFHDYVVFRPLNCKTYDITVSDSRGFMKLIKMKW